MAATPAHGVVDAHLHVVSNDITTFPLQPRGVGRDWWTGRAVDAPSVGSTLRANGVERGVIVQAVGPYFTDNRYARAVVEAEPDRYALVVAIDASAPDAADQLVAEVARGAVAGVRVFAAGGDGSWLADDRARAVWSAAADAGTALVVACFADHLRLLAQRLAEQPDVVVALDHCAFVSLRGGPPYRAADALWDLAALPSVHVKISTIVLEAAAAESTAAFIEHAVAAFGADRLAWGSDHPQSYETGYADMLALARSACVTLDPADAEAILGRTAQRLWFA